jgi:hypothetical protein
MSNDALKVNEMLSVAKNATFGANATIQADATVYSKLSVGSDAWVNGALTANHQVTLNGLASDTTTVKGSSTFEENVTVNTGKNLYAETILTETMGHYDQWNGTGQGTASGQLDMYYESVKIHGDLDIMGQINQSATSVTELFVEDKSILLGASSTSEVTTNTDGSISYTGSNFTVLEPAMHESGVKINGVPGKYTTTAEQDAQQSNKLWEKSFLWNLPGANNTDGTSNMAMNSKNDAKKHLEPFWEMKGGQLRLTSHTQDDDNEFVSFAFRINSKEQLELVKLKSSAANPIDASTKFKTIAKFGNVVES